MACYKRRVQRSSYSLPSLLMHFGFITLPIPPGLDSSFKIRESPPFKDTHVRVVYKIPFHDNFDQTIDNRRFLRTCQLNLFINPIIQFHPITQGLKDKRG